MFFPENLWWKWNFRTKTKISPYLADITFSQKSQRHQQKYFESSEFAKFSQMFFAHSCYSVSGCECRLLVVVLRNCAKRKKKPWWCVFSKAMWCFYAVFMLKHRRFSQLLFFFTFHFTSGIVCKVWQREHNYSINSSQFKAACGNIKLKDFLLRRYQKFLLKSPIKKS